LRHGTKWGPYLLPPSRDLRPVSGRVACGSRPDTVSRSVHGHAPQLEAVRQEPASSFSATAMESGVRIAHLRHSAAVRTQIAVGISDIAVGAGGTSRRVGQCYITRSPDPSRPAAPDAGQSGTACETPRLMWGADLDPCALTGSSRDHLTTTGNCCVGPNAITQGPDDARASPSGVGQHSKAFGSAMPGIQHENAERFV